MNQVFPIGSIVTLGYQHYQEYDIIVRCLQEIDLLEEIQKVREVLGALEKRIDVYLPQIVVELQKKGLIELVRPVANFYWDSGSRNIDQVIVKKPDLYHSVLELLGET